MNIDLFEFHLYQLDAAFAKSRTNIYSDPKKETHLKDLYTLFTLIKESDYKSYGPSDLNLHSVFFDFLFNGIEYLDNSTVNVIPYEILSCLEFALKDFLKNDNIIIVTSFTPDKLGFYFQTYSNGEQFKRMNDNIEKLYGITINKRLVRITLPKSLSRDYLSMVALYHELGHFVDNELKISESYIYAKYGIKPAYAYTAAEIKEYNHRMEYFADIFAAQYVSDSLCSFLNIISKDTSDSQTHPSTIKRIELVNEFLASRNTNELMIINTILPIRAAGEILKQRFSLFDLQSSDFIELVPQDINNVEELHGIFKLGWDFWNSKNCSIPTVISKKDKYLIINNLIEKSISIFSIRQAWIKNKA